MNITKRKLSELIKPGYNPRTISKEEYEGLKESIRTFGYVDLLIVNKRNNHIIGGNQRSEVLQELGYDEIDVVELDIDDKAERKLNVVLNSQAISGKYGDLKLAEILEELKLDDDYESLRLDKLEPLDLSDIEVEEDEAPEVSSEPPVSKLGEVYQLGQHRIMCGDSTAELDTTVLLTAVGDTKADMVFSDPPYGVDYEGKTKDKLKIQNDTDTNTFAEALPNFILATKAGASFYICCPPGNNFKDFFIPFEEHCKLSATIIWVKNSLVMGHGDYHYQHEPILYGWNKNGTHQYYGDRKQTTIWNIDRPTKSKEHPTMKPIELIAKAIQNSSKSGDIVLDLFLGSGSTLIACEQTDRTCYGMGLDPKYVDVIRKRYWKFINDGNEEGWEEGTPKI